MKKIELVLKEPTILMHLGNVTIIVFNGLSTKQSIVVCTSKLSCVL